MSDFTELNRKLAVRMLNSMLEGSGVRAVTCPRCSGAGWVRDRLTAFFTLGIVVLMDKLSSLTMDDDGEGELSRETCPRCNGDTVILVAEDD